MYSFQNHLPQKLYVVMPKTTFLETSRSFSHNYYKTWQMLSKYNMVKMYKKLIGNLKVDAFGEYWPNLLEDNSKFSVLGQRQGFVFYVLKNRFVKITNTNISFFHPVHNCNGETNLRKIREVSHFYVHTYMYMIYPSQTPTQAKSLVNTLECSVTLGIGSQAKSLKTLECSVTSFMPFLPSGRVLLGRSGLSFPAQLVGMFLPQDVSSDLETCTSRPHVFVPFVCV